MQTETEEQLWGTSDLALASYLATEFPVLETDWEGSICYWMFEDCEDLKQMIDEYTNGVARVNPRHYYGAQLMLKKMLPLPPHYPGKQRAS